jgi:hypothetical protein
VRLALGGVWRNRLVFHHLTPTGIHDTYIRITQTVGYLINTPKDYTYKQH